MLAWRKSLGKYGLVKSDCEIPTIKDDEVLVKSPGNRDLRNGFRNL